MVSVAGLIVRTNCFEVDARAESLTVTVKVNTPVCAVVPLRTPEVLMRRPSGTASALTDQVYGVVPPVAVKVRE